jgi:hypothetical protein
MAKGGDGAATQGRNTAVIGGATVACALISMIVAAIGITFTLDSALLKECANADGTYTTKCDATRRLSGALDNEDANMDSVWTRYDPNIIRDLVESKGSHIVTMAKNSHTRRLQTFERMLASHSGNTDLCSTAKNGQCEDQTKEMWSEYFPDECDKNTDTTDCGGMLANSPCKKGECCCRCRDSSTRVTEEVFSFAATGQDKDAESTTIPSSSVCPENTCVTLGASETPSVCQGSRFEVDVRYIGENWNVPSGDGCLACCGLKKETVCAGESDVGSTASINSVLSILREFAIWGALLAIIGVLPAIIGGAAKMQGRDDISNALGAVSLCTSCMCGFAGTGGVTAYLMFLGAIIGTYCQQVEVVFNEYNSALEATCDAACKKALLHQKDAFCNIGTGMTATSIFLFVTLCCAFTTFVMTCIGFCSNKNEVPAPAIQGNPVGTQQVPVQHVQGVVVQAVPVQPVTVQAVQMQVQAGPKV